MTAAKKKVAAVVTEYRKWSHADVILGKILEGYHHDGKQGPDLQLVSLYVDQFPSNDLSKGLAKKHGFTLYDTIDKAVTRGGKSLAVDGVLCIGEHGKYPTNERGQILYPRRRFFEEVCKVFEQSRKSVPVFNDKHLAATWKDAKWMYDRARELYVPLMAGSSLPVTWRRPALKLPRGCPLVEAVQIGYGPLEGYGFHALEGLQCLAERRKGGETGVKSVQCLLGKAMWEALDRGRWSKPLLEAAMKLMPAHAKGDVRELTGKSDQAGVFLIEYRDGFRGAVAMLNGWVYEGDGGGVHLCRQAPGQGQARRLPVLSPAARAVRPLCRPGQGHRQPRPHRTCTLSGRAGPADHRHPRRGDAQQKGQRLQSRDAAPGDQVHPHRLALRHRPGAKGDQAMTNPGAVP